MSEMMKISSLLLMAGLLFACCASVEAAPVKKIKDSGHAREDSRYENDVLSEVTHNVAENEAAEKTKVLQVVQVDQPSDQPAESTPGNLKPGEPLPEEVKPQVAKPPEVMPEEPDGEDEAEEATVADPFEPVNRAMFVFNDKLYFWLFKPVAQAYNAVVPEPVRVSVRNFFRNAAMPIRFVNCLLQGKFESAGIELVRFGVNTTAGLAGFMDIAYDHFDLKYRDEDLGQTLGRWGVGGLAYVVWPFIGPSTLRDTIGMAGDSFLEPFGYISPAGIPMGIGAFHRFNKLALELGTYEDLKNSAVEPYIALRDAYMQHRKDLIRQ